MKISVSIKPKNESERDHLEKTIPDLIKKHTLPIRELLSDSFVRSVHCTRSEAFHEQYKILDDEDHLGLDHLANTYTSIPTFVGLMRHAASDWTLAKLKEKGLIGTAKIKESEPVTPPSNIEQTSSEPEEESGEQTDEAAKTADERVIERLERIDPVAYQFVQEKDIRLISRPKWSWAFEWMRSTFDLEERTDSSGTYFAFLYSPGLGEYQKLTYLIGVIRRDPAFHKWHEAQKIDERGPSSISPAPGTPEYRDYQEQLKEQSYALMAKLGATPEEIAARRRGEAANEWLGQQGLLFEVLQAVGAARQVSPSARGGTPGRWAAKPSGRRRRQPPKRLQKGVQANRKAGNATRDKIAAREAPASKEKNFRTTKGFRRMDVVKEGKELVLIESKVGRTSPTQRVRQEVERDAWLLRNKKVDRIIWEFTRSKITKLVGPTEALQKMLEKAGIEIRINP